MKHTPLALVLSVVTCFVATTAFAYDPTVSLDYALCGYGGGAACENMGYHTSWDVLNAIEPDPYYYQDVQTYPMDCVDVGTGWCGEAQSWLTYARADNYPYWAPQYSYYEQPEYSGYNYYYGNYDWSQYYYNYYNTQQYDYAQQYNHQYTAYQLPQYGGNYYVQPYSYGQLGCVRCY